MSLEALNERVKNDLTYLSFGSANWVRPREHADGRVYDVVIVGGGQSGLGAAFGLLRERISILSSLTRMHQGLRDLGRLMHVW